MGGGLARSAGGWSQVLSLRNKEDKMAWDERVLGSSEFVQSILSEAGKKEKDSLRLSLKKHDLSSIAKRISAGEGIEEAALKEFPDECYVLPGGDSALIFNFQIHMLKIA